MSLEKCAWKYLSQGTWFSVLYLHGEGALRNRNLIRRFLESAGVICFSPDAGFNFLFFLPDEMKIPDLIAPP